MSSFRKLLLVGVGVLALHGVQACATETELNPQPLPPGSGTEQSPAPNRDPNDDSKEGSMGTGGSPTAPADAADAGADGAPDGGPG